MENEQITLLIESKSTPATTPSPMASSAAAIGTWTYVGLCRYRRDRAGPRLLLPGRGNHPWFHPRQRQISGENHPFVEHYKFVKQFEDENYIARQTMPAPAQLLAELYREDNGKNTDAVYPTMSSYCRTLPPPTAQSSVTCTMQAAAASSSTTALGACSATPTIRLLSPRQASSWKTRPTSTCA